MLSQIKQVHRLWVAARPGHARGLSQRGPPRSRRRQRAAAAAKPRQLLLPLPRPVLGSTAAGGACWPGAPALLPPFQPAGGRAPLAFATLPLPWCPALPLPWCPAGAGCTGQVSCTPSSLRINYRVQLAVTHGGSSCRKSYSRHTASQKGGKLGLEMRCNAGGKPS